MLPNKKRTSYLQRNDNMYPADANCNDIADDVANEICNEFSSVMSSNSKCTAKKSQRRSDIFSNRTLRNNKVKPVEFSRPKFPLMEKSKCHLKQIKHNRTIPKPRAHLTTMTSKPEFAKSSLAYKPDSMNNKSVTKLVNVKNSILPTIPSTVTCPANKKVFNSNLSTLNTNVHDKIIKDVLSGPSDADSSDADSDFESFIAKNKVISKRKKIKKYKSRKKTSSKKKNTATEDENIKNKRTKKLSVNTSSHSSSDSDIDTKRSKKKNAKATDYENVSNKRTKNPRVIITSDSSSNSDIDMDGICHDSSNSDVEFHPKQVQINNSIDKSTNTKTTLYQTINASDKSENLIGKIIDPETEVVSVASNEKDQTVVNSDINNSFDRGMEFNAIPLNISYIKSDLPSFSNINKESLIDYNKRPYESIKARCKRTNSPESTVEFSKESVSNTDSFNSTYLGTPQEVPVSVHHINSSTSPSKDDSDIEIIEEIHLPVIEINQTECNDSFVKHPLEYKPQIVPKQELLCCETNKSNIDNHEAVYTTNICKDADSEIILNQNLQSNILVNNSEKSNNVKLELLSEQASNSDELKISNKSSDDDILFVACIKREPDQKKSSYDENFQETIKHGQRALTSLLEMYKKEMTTYQSLIQVEHSTLYEIKTKRLEQATTIKKLRSAIHDIIETYPFLKEMYDSCMKTKSEFSPFSVNIKNQSESKLINDEISEKVQDSFTSSDAYQIPLHSVKQEIPASKTPESQSSSSLSSSFKFDIKPKSEELLELEKTCIVCGKKAVAACVQCAKVFYCSHKCGKTNWHDGHKNSCGK